MAGMVVAVRPTVIVQGVVQAVTPRVKKGTDEVYKFDVTLLTPSGGQTNVEYWERQGQDSARIPDVLERVAIVVEISPPNGNFPASFGFTRCVSENDLDLLVSASPALASK